MLIVVLSIHAHYAWQLSIVVVIISLGRQNAVGVKVPSSAQFYASSIHTRVFTMLFGYELNVFEREWIVVVGMQIACREVEHSLAQRLSYLEARTNCAP